MTNVEELERALEFPWEKWTVFLHPEQQDWVQRSFNGPARVSGSATRSARAPCASRRVPTFWTANGAR